MKKHIAEIVNYKTPKSINEGESAFGEIAEMVKYKNITKGIDTGGIVLLCRSEVRNLSRGFAANHCCGRLVHLGTPATGSPG